MSGKDQVIVSPERLNVMNIKTTDLSSDFGLVGTEPIKEEATYLFDQHQLISKTGQAVASIDPEGPNEFKINRPYAVTDALNEIASGEVAMVATGYRSTVEKPVSGYYWTDQYGTPFGAYITKGNVMRDMQIEKDRNEPSGYRVHGLDSNIKSIPHRIFVSDFFRRNGLYTEEYRAVHRIEEFMHKGIKMKLPELKAALLKEAKAGSEFNEQELEAIEEYINDPGLEFFTVSRSVQSELRMRDLGNIRDKNFLDEKMREVFNWVNYVYGEGKNSEKEQSSDEFEPFGVEKVLKWDQNEGNYVYVPETFDESIVRYFTKWYPIQMGRFLAKMHNLEVTHGFAHSQNWQVYPSLVDLDSVKGNVFGNGEATESDYKSDFLTSFRSLYELFNGNFLARTSKIANLIPYYDGISAQASFALEYFKTRNLFIDPGESQDLPKIFEQYFQDFDIPTKQSQAISSRFRDLYAEEVQEIRP